MTAPFELLKQFTAAVTAKNTDEIGKLRLQIQALKNTTPEAVSTKYRLALYLLHQEKKLPDAMTILSELSSKGVVCDDLHEARISLALCLWNSDKKNQAIFELRKVLSNQNVASIHTTLALDYLTMFLKETKAPDEAIKKAYTERIKQLAELSATSLDADLEAQLKLRLAAALEERQGPGDNQQAVDIYREVSKLTGKITKENLLIAKEALKRLGKK